VAIGSDTVAGTMHLAWQTARNEIMNRLQPLTLGIAIGVLGAAYAFFLGIIAIFGWGTALVETMASLYIGYGPTFIGAIVGAIWAFVDGLIAGLVIGWLYNTMAK
jgi:hypothetical protein